MWLIPFFISFGMGLGTFHGPSSITDAAMQEGPSGDLAGAAGALIFLISAVTGFLMSTLTIIAAKVFRRGVPRWITLKFFLSFAGGGIISSLAAYADEVSTEACWCLLIGGPVLLAWFCGTGKPLPTLSEAV